MTEIDLAIERLERLHAERAELHGELKRSLALQNLCEAAFGDGPNPTSRVVGNPRREMTFTISKGNEVLKALPLEEVPVILWSQKVKDDIRAAGWQARSVYRNLLKEEESNGK
jgi:hypothetical protein